MIWAIKNNERVKAIPKEKANCPICNEEVIAKCGSIKIWHWSHKSNKDCDDWWEPETEWHLDWKNQFPKECQEIVLTEDILNKEHYYFDPNLKHRADIKINNTIIELQNSSISAEKIQEREQFYGDMIWLLNSQTFCKGLDLREKKNSQGLKTSNYKNGYLFNKFDKIVYTFRWKSPPKSWWFADKPIYIDLENFYTKKMAYEDTCVGYCEGEYGQEKVDLYENESCEVRNKIINNKFKEMNNFFKDKIFLINKIYHKIPCGGWGELISKEDFVKQWKMRMIENTKLVG